MGFSRNSWSPASSRADPASTSELPASNQYQQPPVTPEEFESCRQILIQTFSACSDDDFKLISTAITIILTATRRLQMRELQGSVAIFTQGQYQSALATSMTRSEFLQLIRQHPSLFAIHQDSTVSFRPCGMTPFLQNYRVSGIDASHRGIAMVCRTQMQAYRWYDGQRQYSDHAFSFLNYAEINWRHHCQIAMSRCVSLEFDFPVDLLVGVQQLEKDWSDGFSKLQIEDEWIFVKQE